MRRPPIPVLIVAILYVAVGVIGFTFHFKDLYAGGTYYDGVLVELTEICALVCGVFLLRGQNWARWLALAWIGLHVVLSLFQELQGLIVHCLLCALFAWALFYPAASQFFRRRSELSV